MRKQSGWLLSLCLLCACSTTPEIPSAPESYPPASAATADAPAAAVDDTATPEIAEATAAESIEAPPPAVNGEFREVTLASGSTLLLPRGKHQKLRLLVLLPYTGGTSREFYTHYYEKDFRFHCALLLPAGRTDAQDYADENIWAVTISRYDTMIKKDLAAIAQTGVDTTHAVLAGFSMGGDLAWAISQLHPSKFSGAVVMGSRMSYRKDDSPERQAKRGFRYYLTMGADDQASRMKGMADARELLAAGKVNFQYHEVPGAHVPPDTDVFDAALHYVFGRPRQSAKTP